MKKLEGIDSRTMVRPDNPLLHAGQVMVYSRQTLPCPMAGRVFFQETSMGEIVRKKLPEEEELERKQQELAILEKKLAEVVSPRGRGLYRFRQDFSIL